MMTMHGELLAARWNKEISDWHNIYIYTFIWVFLSNCYILLFNFYQILIRINLMMAMHGELLAARHKKGLSDWHNNLFTAFTLHLLDNLLELTISTAEMQRHSIIHLIGNHCDDYDGEDLYAYAWVQKTDLRRSKDLQRELQVEVGPWRGPGLPVSNDHICDFQVFQAFAFNSKSFDHLLCPYLFIYFLVAFDFKSW